ncbi:MULTISPECIES: carboxylating nicotinate-nucleotide diphosphorylase [unclassified Leptolyngbya]|uniref:carboxylating nicotinate-nucleotide diphosphorylase n=1 Tax=unclassified Leptolyngbya TaxID=2650499 RepID=UPI001682F36A|nr:MULTISPECIES: carboxylating nicotinate-nucleotide diphosphorylase [unclassified Leptolyngbya]MBD1909949.1 carboxylating nicotinate-nucleotide diphosphorylase [Leptolyngbya sp. FACHB-8]MBD2159054.1 carboxylating nicotinate-nucleotide diphosphorylase [Leptolyngbya sp. FACHB-16]
MVGNGAALPTGLVLDGLLREWLLEDVGRGDRTTEALQLNQKEGKGQWICKEEGVIAGLPIAVRVFQLLSAEVEVLPLVAEGAVCDRGQPILKMEGPLGVLLTGERVALNLAMRLSGIATTTRRYAEKIADLPTRLVDTRKTTPGLRVLEKYATRVGGALNHRMGLDDAVMIKDNHIVAAGGIETAIAQIRAQVPYPLAIEVETETLEQVTEALRLGADIIMLDNMPLETMQVAVGMIREANKRIKIEASGNVTLETIRAVAETGVDYVSTSAPITRSSWLDLSMRLG